MTSSGVAGRTAMPVSAFAEFAVADNVDAGFRLLANHFGDGFGEAGFKTGRGVGLAGLDCAPVLDQFGRADQTADMGGQNTVRHGQTSSLKGAFGG